MSEYSYSGADSLCSNMSEVSINYDGEEVELGEAVDHIFKEIQHHINQTHCEIRQIVQWEDRNETYEETKVYFDDMELHIREGCALFKDLIKVMRQVLPKKPKEPKPALDAIKE